MGKYTRLAEFLAAQHASEVVMSFADLERVIGERLPAQASTERGWWRRDPAFNEIAQGWREAGFKTERVDLEARRLVFRRAEPKDARKGWKEGDPIPLVNGRHPIFGALKGSIAIAPGVDLTEPACPEWAEIAENKTR